jgi:uncharacterized membrane protein
MNKRVFLLKVVTTFFSGLLIFSCAKDMGKLPKVTNTPVTPTPVNICDSATYNIKIKAIIDTKCAIAGCHNAGSQAGGTILNDYATVKAKADGGRIKARVIDANPSIMPQSGSPQLTANELSLIQCWLDKGSPQ